MEKCSKCNDKQLVVGNSAKCPKCGEKICNHCLVQNHNKCPHCGHPHMMRLGGIEDKRKS